MNSLFGQYQYKNTFIHRLDPRIKIILVLFTSMLLFSLKTYTSFIIITVLISTLLIISKINITTLLKNLRPFLFFFTFIFLMYFFFSREELAKGILTIWRFVLLILTSSILTFTTSISNMVYAIEKLGRPLKIIKVSPRNIAVMLSITIRFIPLLFTEANIVRDAQKSRGADLKKPKHIIGFVNALLRKTFNKASTLADSMESRCYRDYSYSHFKELKLTTKDIVSFAIIITLFGALIWV